jgi:Pectate lyase superfamily protein
MPQNQAEHRWLSEDILTDGPIQNINYYLQQIGASGLSSGLAANRPVTPTVAPFYYATDTQALSFWNGSAWTAVTFGGAQLNTANVFTQPQTLPVWDIGGAVFNVKAYGAKGDGSTDDTTAIQAAITAAAVNGGTVRFPTGTFIINSGPLTVTGFKITLVGAGKGATVLSNTGTSDMFTLASAGALSYFNHSKMTLTSGASSGHIYNVSNAAGVGSSIFSELQFNQNNINNAVYNSINKAFIQNVVEKCAVYGLQTHTLPLWYCVSTTNGINDNVFRDCRGGDAGFFVFWLEEQGGPVYASNNLFENINFEIANHGGIRIRSGFSTIIRNCTSFDATTITNYLIQVDKAGGANSPPPSTLTTCENITRYSGTLSGAVDIQFVVAQADRSRVERCYGFGGSAFAIDFGPNTSGTAFDCYDATITNPPTNFLKLGSSGAAGALIQTVGQATTAITSGALPTVSPSSGTAFQCLTTRDVTLITAVTATLLTGTATIAISPDNSTFTTVGVAGPGVAAAVDLVTLQVPAAWWVKITLSNATVTCRYY